MADTAQRSSAAELRSLGGLALAAADRHSGDAMRAPGRSTITYADFGRAIREIAGGLASLGVETGDPVAILCGTVPEWTMADFGAFCAGDELTVGAEQRDVPVALPVQAHGDLPRGRSEHRARDHPGRAAAQCLLARSRGAVTRGDPRVKNG